MKADIGTELTDNKTTVKADYPSIFFYSLEKQRVVWEIKRGKQFVKHLI